MPDAQTEATIQEAEDLDSAIENAESPAGLTDLVATFMDVPVAEKQERIDELFQVAVPDVGTGIDVDGGHGFSLINHQMTTGFQLHFTIQRLLNFIVDTV